MLHLSFGERRPARRPIWAGFKLLSLAKATGSHPSSRTSRVGALNQLACSEEARRFEPPAIVIPAEGHPPVDRLAEIAVAREIGRGETRLRRSAGDCRGEHPVLLVRRRRSSSSRRRGPASKRPLDPPARTRSA